MPDQAASSLPDQDMQPSPNDGNKRDESYTADAEDNARQSTAAPDSKQQSNAPDSKRKSKVTLEADDAETKKKRTSRTRLQSDVAMLAAVISDTEQEEEEEGSDAEFVARKGSKKVMPCLCLCMSVFYSVLQCDVSVPSIS